MTAATITVDDISDSDVLCGRGSRINTHPGNVTYREICQAYMTEYGLAKKIHKPLVSKRIVQLIKEQGGRFLQRTKVPDEWEEIEDKKAAEKTGQALRSSLYSAQAVGTDVKQARSGGMAKRMLVTPPRDSRFLLPRHQELPTLAFDLGIKRESSSSSSSRSGESSDGSTSPSAVPQLYPDNMMQPFDTLGAATSLATSSLFQKLPPGLAHHASQLDQQQQQQQSSSDAFALQQMQLMQFLQAQQRQHQLDLWNPVDMGIGTEDLLFS